MEAIWRDKKEGEREKAGGKNFFWTQSGASLREKPGTSPEEVRGPKGGKKSLRRLENAYGSISFGTDGKGSVEILAARRTGCREDGLRNDQKRMEEGHQAPVRMGGAVGYTDSARKEDSAVVWKEKASVSPERIMEELKRLSRLTRQETLDDMMPSLLREMDGTDRNFHYNLLNRIKKNLKEALEETRRLEEERRESGIGRVYLRTADAERTDAEDGREEDETGEAPLNVQPPGQ